MRDVAAAASSQLVARAALPLLLSPRFPPIPRPQSIMNPSSSSSSPPGGYHSRTAAPFDNPQPRGGGARRGGRGGGGGDGDRIGVLGSSSSSSSAGYHSMPTAAASPQPRDSGGRWGGRGGGGWRGGRGGGNGSDRIDALGSSSFSSSGGYHSITAAASSPQPRGGGGWRGGRGGGRSGRHGGGNGALGSSSSASSSDYNYLAAALDALHLREGGGGGRGGHGGGDGSERIDAPRSSPPPAGYHSSAAAFASPQPRGGGGGNGRNRIAALGRIMSRILRHLAVELGLDMRTDGYVRVSDLLKLNLQTYAEVPLKNHTVDEVREAVRRDNKQRFSLLEEDGELFIRANQGHTVTTVTSESLLTPILSADEVSLCVHGTYRKKLRSILRSGLKRMTRLHVHFSSGLPSSGEVISGMRPDINILIHLDVKKALHDGIKLYISDNKVILTEGFDGVVPVKYFDKIETWPGRAPIPFER